MNQEPNYEELLDLVLNFYHSFRQVMLGKNKAHKLLAMRGFQKVQDAIRERVGSYSEAKHIDFSLIDKILEQRKGEMSPELLSKKEAIEAIAKEIEPALEKLLPQRKGKKKGSLRKNRMEKRLRSRD